MTDAAIQPYIQSLLDALGPRDPLAVLAATPEALRQAVAGVGPAALDRPEAPGKWSLRQVVQHDGSDGNDGNDGNDRGVRW